jgi:hypothetical protein
MLIIFFIVPCQKAANASNSGTPPKGKAGRIYFYAFSLRSVKGNACGSLVASPSSLFFEYIFFGMFL